MPSLQRIKTEVKWHIEVKNRIKIPTRVIHVVTEILPNASKRRKTYRIPLAISKEGNVRLYGVKGETFDLRYQDRR